MTAASPLEIQVAQQGEKIQTLEQQSVEIRADHKELRAQLDSLRNWIMGTLAAAAGGLLLQLVKLLASK